MGQNARPDRAGASRRDFLGCKAGIVAGFGQNLVHLADPLAGLPGKQFILLEPVTLLIGEWRCPFINQPFEMVERPGPAIALIGDISLGDDDGGRRTLGFGAQHFAK